MALSSRPGGGHSSRPLSEINVTPFVDVMLVLLVIFMVTAPLLEWGIQVELPRTVSGKLAGPKRQWTITLTKERAVYLNKQKLSLDGLDGKLGSLAREDPSAEIFLRADRRLPYGFVMRVVSKVRENGLTQLGLVTDLEDPLPEP